MNNDKIEKGQPVQILDFSSNDNEPGENSSSTMYLKTVELNNICKVGGDRPVILISIAGPSRKGKSFFLSFIIRYLESLEDSSCSDWIGLNNKDQPLHGFQWGNGYEIQTSGIWLWSRPFIIKNGEGRECAVIIMDTQGVFDEETDETDWCRIIGLSLLLSSVTILNMSELLEDSLKQLNIFIDYGLLVIEKQEPGISKPFGKLLFLLRDWNNPDEFPYGELGGQNFLNKKLEFENKKKMSPSSKKVRKTIRECFQDLECFLLPPPGEKAKCKTFDGSIDKMEETFSSKIAECIETNFAPNKLKILKSAGVEVKCRNLLDYFSKFVEILSNEEMPSSLSLYEATAQITNTNLVESIFDEYKEKINSLEPNAFGFIPHNQLEESQTNLLAQQLHLYNSEKKHGNEKLWTEFSSKLEKMICKEYRSILSRNKILLKDSIKRENVNICELYKESMHDKIEHECFLEQEEFENCTKENMSFCMGIYKSAFESEDIKLVKIYEEKLSSKLKEAQMQMDLRNQIARSTINQLNKSVNEYFFQKYTEYLLEIISGKPNLNSKELEKAHVEFISKYSEQILKERQGKPSLIFEYEQLLKEKIDSKYRELTQTISINQSGSKSILESLLTESLGSFEKALDSLKTEYNLPISSYMDTIKSIENDLQQRLDETLVETMNENPHTFTENFDQYSKNINKVKQEKINEYKAKIKEHRMMVELQLQLESNKFQQALDKKLGNFSNTHITMDEMSNFTKETLECIADEFENFANSMVNSEDSQNYVQELYSKLYEIEEQTKGQLKTKLDEATYLANAFATSSKAYYQEKMAPYVAAQLPKNEEEFRNVHVMLLGDAKSRFLANGYTYNKFVNKFLEEIEIESEKMYKHFLELFKVTLGEKVLSFRKQTQSVLLNYSQEMQKHVNGDIFLEPSVLRKLHDKAVTNCLKQIEQLHDLNKDEISNYLEKFFMIYKDKNNLLTPLHPNNVAIGIDLGTTHTSVAIYLNGETKIIPYDGNISTPSCVAFGNNGELFFGEKAKKFEKIDQSIYDVKRMIGLPFTDKHIQNNLKNWNFVVDNVENSPEIKVLGKHYPPEYISGLFLRELKYSAQQFLKDKLGIETELQNAVIAVPACFTDGQLLATEHAASIAGLNVLRMAPEPILAAVFYRDYKMKLETFEKFVLVFDLGGGTLDVTLLQVSGNDVISKVICSDSELGGQDFDLNMVNYCLKTYYDETGIDVLGLLTSKDAIIKKEAERAIHMLRIRCEESKRILSSSQNVEISVCILNEQSDLNLLMSRSKFEDLNQHLFAKTIHLVEKVLKSAGLEKDQIEDIVLVGGSTRIPKIQEMVSNFFNGKIITTSTKTAGRDEAVARGAAIIAAVCNGEIAQEAGNYVRFTNVTPRSFGIRQSNGDFSIIIPKGTPIPSKVMKVEYTTAIDNQTKFTIKVYEGESSKANDNHFLGDFVLSGIPPRKAKEEKMYLTMLVDSNGILHVTAKSKSEHSKTSLVITENKCRLDKATIEKYTLEKTDAMQMTAILQDPFPRSSIEVVTKHTGEVNRKPTEFHMDKLPSTVAPPSNIRKKPLPPRKYASLPTANKSYPDTIRKRPTSEGNHLPPQTSRNHQMNKSLDISRAKSENFGNAIKAAIAKRYEANGYKHDESEEEDSSNDEW